MATSTIKSFDEKASAAMVCESCGAEFFCGAKIGECWCFTVEVKSGTLLNLRGKFEDCLCENCLLKTSSEIVSEEKTIGSQRN